MRNFWTFCPLQFPFCVWAILTQPSLLQTVVLGVVPHPCCLPIGAIQFCSLWAITIFQSVFLLCNTKAKPFGIAFCNSLVFPVAVASIVIMPQAIAPCPLRTSGAVSLIVHEVQTTFREYFREGEGYIPMVLAFVWKYVSLKIIERRYRDQPLYQGYEELFLLPEMFGLIPIKNNGSSSHLITPRHLSRHLAFCNILRTPH